MESFITKITDTIPSAAIAEVLLVIILIMACFLVWSARNYLRMKAAESEALVKLKAFEQERIAENLREQPDPFCYRIDSGQKMLDLIQTMISDEIVQMLFTYQSIDEKYKLINLNKDASVIAKTVYEGINTNIITSKNSFFTPEYLMHLITQVAMITLVNSVRDYNNQLRIKEIESREE